MKKLALAQLPTPIRLLDGLSRELGCNLFIKQDELTGMEYSGNKIRKLEYSLAQALDLGCDTLITCGGIQSNHCRATVSAGLRLGLSTTLLLRLRNPNEDYFESNYLLDKVMGADIRFCTADEYRNNRNTLMEDIARELKAAGKKPYIIPEGASNGIGTFGYMNALQEIAIQEQSMGITFDAVVVATGSGGTYSGLFLDNLIHQRGKHIIGYCVCDDRAYFQDTIWRICHECLDLMSLSMNVNADFSKEAIDIRDEYVGIGYALSRPEEIEFIGKVARMEGVILDPVYTGKALYGLCSDLQKWVYPELAHKNVLFINTGGLFGLFTRQTADLL